ncbi:MAG TPA: thiol:disulfide interchange protein DsbA/DsbL [Steroidobacteraceae bacterium]|nr:thiol:disulfide interchange protein DsbA/DsbL [Steroidobacteraceae bacterium]
MRHFITSIAFALFATISYAGSPGSPAGWQEGVHYTKLESVAPRVTPPGTIEVVQVFRYSCSVCNAFEPHLVAWIARKPRDVAFVRIPVTWTQSDRAEARLFLTLHALHREDLHQAVYDAFHKEKMRLNAPLQGDSMLLQAKFADAHGVRADEFKRAFSSQTIDQEITRAAQQVHRYRVTGTPSIVVDGKYTTSMGQAGGAEKLIALIDYLVALERRESTRRLSTVNR